MRLSELKTRYMDYLLYERSLAKQTVTAYISDIDRMTAIIGDADVQNITLDDLRGYIRTMRKQGAAVATITRRIHSLNTFYKWLVLENIVPEAISTKLQTPRKEVKQPVWLSDDELKTFVTTPSRLAVAWVLLGWFGLRRSEVLSVTWADIKLDEGIIIIRGTKSKKDRVLPIPSTCAEMLRGMAAGKLPSARVVPLAVAPFARAFKRHVIKCGLDYQRVTPHTIRHSFASMLIKQGVGITAVKDLLGHKDIKTTMLYIHHNDEILQNAMARHVLN